MPQGLRQLTVFHSTSEVEGFICAFTGFQNFTLLRTDFVLLSQVYS